MKQKLIDHLRENKYIINDGFLGPIQLLTPPIGEGANGIVYEAYLMIDKEHKMPLAIKFLANQNNDKIERFRAEYLNPIWAELKHSVCSIQAGVISDDQNRWLYIIMKKYVCNLDKIIKSHEISKADFMHYFKELREAILEMHSKHIIHRDIKPQNILLDEDKKLYISDYGIASYSSDDYCRFNQTTKGERLANRGFSAPEQEYANVKPTKMMDIYSMAQVMYALCYKHPYRDSKEVNLDCASEMSPIISRCLIDDPSERPQSVEELNMLIEEQNESRKYFETCRMYADAAYEFRLACNMFSPECSSIKNISSPDQIKWLFSEVLQNRKKLDQIRIVAEFTNFSDYDICDIVCSDDMMLTMGHQKFKIADLWVVKDSTCSAYDNDFILLHHIPFNLPDGFKHVWYYKDQIISSEEANSGFYRLPDGKTEKIIHEYLEFIEYMNHDGYIIMGAPWNCLGHVDNELIIRDTLTRWANNTCDNLEDEINDLRLKMRKNHFTETRMFI